MITSGIPGLRFPITVTDSMPARLGAPVGLSALALSALVSLVSAQQPPPPKTDSAFVLPGISVTSARHAASPLLLPFAITRVNAREWQGARGFGLEDALAKVPGVLAQSRYGSSDLRLVIRGFGARGAGDRSNAGTTRGIRILLDGFPETEPDGRTSFDGIDLASASAIEVIRSNASSTYGNAAGGVVNISTLPEFDRPFGEFEVGTGAFGMVRLIGRAGTAWSTSRLAGSVVRTDFDGWRHHSDARRTLLNVAMSAQVDRRTRLALYAMGTSNQFRIPGPLTQAQVDADPSQANAIYQSRDERRFNRLGRFGATAEHEIGRAGTLAASAFVTPKVLQRSERGTFRDFTRYHVGGNVTYAKAGSLGGTARGNFQAGLDEAYQDGAILFYSLTAQGTRGPELRDNKREGANNLGLFAQSAFELGEHWAVTVGGRFDRVTYYSQNFIDSKLDADKAFQRITPKAAINFRPTPRHSFYANVGGGVEVPAGNETDPANTFGQPDLVTALNPLLDAIRSTTFEVGTKQVLLPAGGLLSDLSYDVALYHTRVTNDIVPYRGGRFYFTAAKTRRTGAELSLTARSRGGLTVGTALTYSNNRYTEYVVDSIHYNLPAGHLADYGGNKMVGVPDWMYNFTLGYAPTRLSGFRLQLGVQGGSTYFVDDANGVRVPGYTVLSATASLDDPVALGRGLGARGYVTVSNLSNHRYIGSAFLNPDIVGGVPVAFEPGLPRALIVGLAVGWR
jgi:iron complex outermembrane receptor protein